jgi:hypothetical protein
MKKRMYLLSMFAVLSVISAVFAASLTGTTFGDATDLGGGTFKLVSDASPGYGGVDFNTPTSFNFSDIAYLGTVQTPESDDTCVGGSPRFQLNVDTDGDGDSDGNVFVYTQFANCPGDTGDLTGTNGELAGTYDLSQFGGSVFTTYSDAVAFFAANPGFKIVGIQLVIDSGWAFADGEQTVTVTPRVELSLQQPGNTNACKNGGWQSLVDADGNTFKNQGQCVAFVASGGKSGGKK